MGTLRSTALDDILGLKRESVGPEGSPLPTTNEDEHTLAHEQRAEDPPLRTSNGLGTNTASPNHVNLQAPQPQSGGISGPAVPDQTGFENSPSPRSRELALDEEESAVVVKLEEGLQAEEVGETNTLPASTEAHAPALVHDTQPAPQQAQTRLEADAEGQDRDANADGQEEIKPGQVSDSDPVIATPVSAARKRRLSASTRASASPASSSSRRLTRASKEKEERSRSRAKTHWDPATGKRIRVGPPQGRARSDDITGKAKEREREREREKQLKARAKAREERLVIKLSPRQAQAGTSGKKRDESGRWV